jgi:hypothetical protein
MSEKMRYAGYLEFSIIFLGYVPNLLLYFFQFWNPWFAPLENDQIAICIYITQKHNINLPKGKGLELRQRLCSNGILCLGQQALSSKKDPLDTWETIHGDLRLLLCVFGNNFIFFDIWEYSFESKPNIWVSDKLFTA